MKINLPTHLWLILACIFNSTVLQAAPLYRSLKEHSPFLPSQTYKTPVVAKKVAPDEANERFALKGISKIGRTYLFSIFDKLTSKSQWIEAGADLNGFVIKSYDPEMHQVEFTWNGQTCRIQLEHSEQGTYQLVSISLPGEASASEHSAASSIVSGETKAPAKVLMAIRKRMPGDLSLANSPESLRNSSIIDFAVTRSNRTKPANNLMADTDSKNDFAAIDPKPESPTEITSPTLVASSGINPLSIFPRTTVENPNGKIPDHLR